MFQRDRENGDAAICAFRFVIFITSRDPNWVTAVAPWVTTPAQPLHLRRGGQVPARSNLTAGRGTGARTSAGRTVGGRTSVSRRSSRRIAASSCSLFPLSFQVFHSPI